MIHISLLSLLVMACGDKKIEGTEPGDCTDLADNDADGMFDCDDDGCKNSPECTGQSEEPSDDPVDEPANEELDNDADGVLQADDCDDENSELGSISDDQDCDGILTDNDCDDTDDSITNTNENDADCDTVISTVDCDDTDGSITNTNENDVDCDTVITANDCDDENAESTIISEDGDCDGVLTADDCDDTSIALTAQADDTDCDGVLTIDDCDDTNNANTNICMKVTLSGGTEIVFAEISGSDLLDPLGRYSLSNAFYIMTTEVTQGMFQDVMGYDSRDGEDTLYGDGDNYPAYYVSWHMAAHFANALSLYQGEQTCYTCTGTGTSVTCTEDMDPYLCTGYSLPTEHEWELAGRSGTTSDHWTGDGPNLGGEYSTTSCSDEIVLIEDGVTNPPLTDYAWFCNNNSIESSQEVATKLPNGFGLYDMHGNVSEWVADWYTSSYPTTNAAWSSSGEERGKRGAGWSFGPYPLGLSVRYMKADPASRSNVGGFRIRKLATP